MLSRAALTVPRRAAAKFVLATEIDGKLVKANMDWADVQATRVSVDISGEEFIGKAFQFKKMIATDVEGEIEWVKTFNRDQMKNNNKRWYGLIKITKGDVDMKEIIFHPEEKEEFDAARKKLDEREEIVKVTFDVVKHTKSGKPRMMVTNMKIAA
ncbi:unnamed protein product [Oikopleura dioica]|uniref:Uncharacterized protein n=1 Tax=Oikopleura dioica TaxID=34765 RepID=E4WUK2_OIKDI|nr:unnamed protein product [Oikopleura dioica]